MQISALKQEEFSIPIMTPRLKTLAPHQPTITSSDSGYEMSENFCSQNVKLSAKIYEININK